MSGPEAALVFTVPGKPQSKQRPRLGKGGRVYTPKATKRYDGQSSAPAECDLPRAWQPKRGSDAL